MFDSIIIRKSLLGTADIDIGLFAECLLFYRNVHVVADMSILRKIVEHLGLDILEELVSQHHLTLSFSPFLSATHTTAESTPKECFNYCYITRVPSRDSKPDYEALFFEMLEKGSEKAGKSRRIGRRIWNDVHVIEANKLIFDSKGIPEIARQSLEDETFVSSAIKTTIQHIAPRYEIPSDCEFIIERHSNGLNFQTNIDFARLNKLKNNAYFSDTKSQITKAYLLDTILKAHEDLFFSAHFKSELITKPLISSIIDLKFSNIIEKATQNSTAQNLFQEVILPDAKMIREVINSGEKSFADILPLLENSKKFKRWVHPLDGDDTVIIEEYYRSRYKNSWVDDLPTKLLRFTVFTQAGIMTESIAPLALGGLIEIGLNVGDTFLLEKLIKGWKPDQYVDQLKNFVK